MIVVTSNKHKLSIESLFDYFKFPLKNQILKFGTRIFMLKNSTVNYNASLIKIFVL